MISNPSAHPESSLINQNKYYFSKYFSRIILKTIRINLNSLEKYLQVIFVGMQTVDSLVLENLLAFHPDKPTQKSRKLCLNFLDRVEFEASKPLGLMFYIINLLNF